MMRFLTLAALALALAACAADGAPPAREALRTARPAVILISIDGFHPDYLDREITPHLSRLAAEGARGRMRPSFPSKTFPNHYTLVTGLTPDRHGVVDNTMLDPEIPGVTFSLGNKAAVADAAWWNDATPIWVTAERAGIKAGTMFWPGSEAAIQGVRPSYTRTFDMAVTPDQRVDQVLAWLDLPAGAQPGFLTLYFDDVDTAGHRYGPVAPETDSAIARVDAALGRLLEGLATRGAQADLVITSDHGMAAIAPDRVIPLADVLPPGLGRVLTAGAFLAFYPAEDETAAAEAALLRPHPHMQCWRRSDIPARFGYGRHRRAPPIFCLAETGWEIVTPERLARGPVTGGDHGFDPFHPDMAAVFVAWGPRIRDGVTVAPFDNVDVYPLLARLIGVAPEPNQGDLDELSVALEP